MASFLAVVIIFLVLKCVQLFFRDLKQSPANKRHYTNKGGVHFIDGYRPDSGGWGSGGSSDGGSGGGGDCGGGGGE